MDQEIVLVTGAAGGQQGKTGRYVSELLLARGARVRAFVHRIDERSDHLRALGAEIVQGDFHENASVERALHGVSTVYFAYPVQAGLLEATAIMADAARRAGVKRIVDMVMLVSAPDAPTPRMRENYLSEQIFEWSGIPTTHVRATVFYENVRALVAGTLAKDGAVLLPWGSATTVLPLVAGEDVARVAAGVLSGPTQPSGTVVPVIGEVLSLGEMIAILSRVRGRDVKYHEITDQLWHDGALARGLNPHAAEHLTALWRTLRNSQTPFAVTDTIEKLGGSRPKSFEQFARAELAA
jgi:uncharacterized protein YbjT (DUF2867 family)